MIWIIATLAAVAVLGGLGAVLAGRLPMVGMSAATTSVPDLQLTSAPSSRDVTYLRFDTALRGYRISQVDDALDVLQGRLAELEHEVETLRAGHGPAGHDPRGGAR